MGNFDFNCNTKILVNGQDYTVVGAIYYSNTKDHCGWVEYCITNEDACEMKYLSIDEDYHEYAIYTKEYNRDIFSDSSLVQNGFHEVDRGTAKVTRFWGNSDVEVGNSVQFCEYEDSSEEKIMAIERWDDETEYSTGYYLDENEIQLLSQVNNNSHWNNSEGNYNSGGTYAKPNPGLFNNKNIYTIAIIILFLIFNYSFGILLEHKSIAKYLKESSNYTYATSITSNQKQSEKADVYTTSLSVDLAVKSIIDMLQGDLISVQQNTEDEGDGSVAILIKKEYCLVYKNTDGLTTVQISSRLYTYTSDSHPYHSSAFTSRYYRRYYYSNAYSSDNSSYKKYNSSYSSFDDSSLTSNYSDPYSTYSNSVRQSSASSRSSSGGGTSSGK